MTGDLDDLPEIDLTPFDDPNDDDYGFELDGFSLDLEADDQLENGFCKPRITKPKCVTYDSATALSANIKAEPGANYYAIVSGNFIFGDIIEAFIINKALRVQQLTVCTLSMSENNVDSLVNIMLSGLCSNLHLIISSYFFAHERQGLIKYIHDELENKPWKFTLSVAGTHMKVCLIKTEHLFITMHGSANLRSSRNIEQFSLTESRELYEFNEGIMNAIASSYAINRKGGDRGNKIWQKVLKQTKPAAQSENA